MHYKDCVGVEYHINRQLAEFGYKYHELAEFACPEYDMCDIDGYELTDERGDYMRARIDEGHRYQQALGWKGVGRESWRDEEDSSTFGYTEHQGNRTLTQWHDDGKTTYHWGGPCAPTTYDKHGEEC